MSDVRHTAEQAPDQPTVGQMLRAARESISLSAADVARQLRLGLRQIEALEADEFHALPGNTIVRGFIRNYAKLLQSDAGPFLAAYERSSPQREENRIAGPAEHIDISPRPSRRWLWYVLGVVVLVLGAPLLIYALLHDEGPARLRAKTPPGALPSSHVAVPMTLPAPAPLPSGQAQKPAAPGAESTPTVSLPGASTTASAGPSTAAGVPHVAGQEPASPSPMIGMSFAEDSWVEIRDKSGKKIFSQLNRQGTQASVEGRPPFSLVIGNATNVRLTYKGKPVDLQPYTKVNVARLTLE
jgi:cytoskeleton protein RodZ